MNLTNHIITIEDEFPVQFAKHAAELARMPVHRWAAYVTSKGQPLPAETNVAIGQFAKAYINHGRWVVDCPASACGGAQLASTSDRRWLCHECHNVMAQGAPLSVIWPEPRKQQRIEELLLLRMFPAARNWTPREKIADLERENAENREMVRA